MLNTASLKYLQTEGDDFRNALPFPHAVIDDFFSLQELERLKKEFDNLPLPEWRKYFHFNEKKYGFSDLSRLATSTQAIIKELYSEDFCRLLSDFTGIPGLTGDFSLTGAGLHLTAAGGFLNIHQDFQFHPHYPRLQRKINLIIYLSEDYTPGTGGELELWDAAMTQCVQRIEPLYNRAVIFSTGEKCFHGHPQPLIVQKDFKRKSLALYYYTPTAKGHYFKTTMYRTRPGEYFQKCIVTAENIALKIAEPVRRLTFKLRNM